MCVVLLLVVAGAYSWGSPAAFFLVVQWIPQDYKTAAASFSVSLMFVLGFLVQSGTAAFKFAMDKQGAWICLLPLILVSALSFLYLACFMAKDLDHHSIQTVINKELSILFALCLLGGK